MRVKGERVRWQVISEKENALYPHGIYSMRLGKTVRNRSLRKATM
jgi:hypothetical protein